MSESQVIDEEVYILRRPRTPEDLFSTLREKLITYWVLARFPWRFQFALMGVLFTMVFGRAVYDAPLYSIPILITAFVIISLMNAGGCAINDYFDGAADAISKPYRPIPAGNISPRGVLEYTAVTFVLAAALAAYINLLAFAIVVFTIIWLILYSAIFKRAAGFFSNACISFAVSLTAVFGEALLVRQISYLSLSFVPMVVAGGMAYNTLKDIQTAEGDAKVGYTTLAVTRGTHAALGAFALIMILSSVFFYIPFILGIVGIAFAIVVTIRFALSVIVIQTMLRKPDPLANTKKVEAEQGVIFALVPIALLAGAFF
jgi:geranylgeranylglycerol-phosphate geranylgeranyltransferase